MTRCFFASDLHGKVDRYTNLLRAVEAENPALVFLGGDLCPSGLAPWDGPASVKGGFLAGYLLPELDRLRRKMGSGFPRFLVILGNDDMMTEEPVMVEGEDSGLWTYLHGRKAEVEGHSVFGYGFVPPTPFLWKDWERYDVSRYVPPGSVSPEEGWRTVKVDDHWVKYGTIKGDLDELVKEEELSRAVFLFHTPPHETTLDPRRTRRKVSGLRSSGPACGEHRRAKVHRGPAASPHPPRPYPRVRFHHGVLEGQDRRYMDVLSRPRWTRAGPHPLRPENPRSGPS